MIVKGSSMNNRAIVLWLISVLVVVAGCSATPTANAGPVALLDMQAVEANVIRHEAVMSHIWPESVSIIDEWSVIYSEEMPLPSWGSYPHWQRLAGKSATDKGGSLVCPKCQWVIYRYDGSNLTTADRATAVGVCVSKGIMTVRIAIHKSGARRALPVPASLLVKLWDIDEYDIQSVEVVLEVSGSGDFPNELPSTKLVRAPVIFR